MSKEREPASGAPQGARRATGGAPEERRDGRGRWSAKRKTAAVLRLLRARMVLACAGGESNGAVAARARLGREAESP